MNVPTRRPQQYVKQFSVFTNRKTGTIKTHSAILCVERKIYPILYYYYVRMYEYIIIIWMRRMTDRER